MAAKILKFLYYLFLTCIAVIALLLVVSAFPITGNIKFLTVLSGSMEPVIKTGSVVVVKPVNDYKVGDIITFGPYSKTKAPTTHRIQDIKVQGGEPVYITKGDANNASDTRTVTKRDIVGKVVLDVPYIGYAVAAAKKPIGFALIIIVPAAIIVYDEIRKVWAEIKKLRKKTRKKNDPEDEKEN